MNRSNPPPKITPLVESETEPPLSQCISIKSPKFVASPVDANVTISFLVLVCHHRYLVPLVPAENSPDETLVKSPKFVNFQVV